MTSSTSLSGCPRDTITMSGRGTMISRTTVSPSSKIEWIISRSDRSMTSSLSATSIISRTSSSVTNGPCARPLPGARTLASLISRLASGHRGRATRTTIGAVQRATSSLRCTASVLGAASAATNSTADPTTAVRATPGHVPR